MKTVLTLIKLQFKAGVKLERAKSKAAAVLKLLGAIIFIMAALFVFVSIYVLITMQFTAPFINEDGITTDLKREFLVFTFLGFQILQTLFLVPILYKNLNINNERETLLKLPVKQMQIFISKFIVSYIFELIFTAFVLLPILIAFGVVANAATAFWLFIPFTILLMPAPVFFLATLLIFPINFLIMFLKGRPYWTFLVYAVALGILAFLYMKALEGTAYLVINRGLSDTLRDNAVFIADTSKYFILQGLFAKVLMGGFAERLINFGICAGVFIILIAAAFVIANLLYKHMYIIESSKGRSYTKKEDFKKSSETCALVKKELKNIFRSSNYSFQFLLIIVIMPLYVFFCNQLAAYSSFESFRSGGIGEAALKTTQDMIFGITLLVITILIPLINSFAATNITREGNSFYSTKIIPVSIRKQLLVKFFICLIPTTAVICLSSLIILVPVSAVNLIGSLPTITISQSLKLFAIATLLSVGYIALGTYLDLSRPLCVQVGGGELIKTTRHINTVLLLGLSIAAVFGSLSIFGPFFFKNLNLDFIYWPVAAIFAIFAFSLLYISGPKKYHKIEQ
ncbi:MAG: hypothetical protein FWG51_01995 [Firmicutes bacterium]|nr:hypothetical protein [Bacillota bacterium]